MADVFISYARENQDFVLKIHKALEARNKDTWIDWKDIPLTAKWLDEVFSGIERGDAFAFVISPGLTIAWGISRWSQFIDAAASAAADFFSGRTRRDNSSHSTKRRTSRAARIRCKRLRVSR